MEKLQAPKQEPASICGRLCGEDKMTHLTTRLDLVQGEVLEILEKAPFTLRQLMQKMEWPPCAIAMSVGSLLGEGLIRSTEHQGEVMLEIYVPKAPETGGGEILPDFIEALQEDVCMHCVEFGEDGQCHSENDSRCAIFRFLPELVRISQDINSTKIDDYIAAVRSRVCAQCSHAEGEKCSIREKLDCGLDRYLSLVIDSLERVKDRLSRTKAA